jgi:hypothetical protein
MSGYSGFWNESGQPYSLLVNKNPRRNAIRRTVNREGFRVVTELFDTLIGAGVGGTASASHARVKHTTDARSVNVGAVETVTDINRASTSADVTLLKEMTFGVVTAPSYPADASGNGGPAKP